MLVSLAIFICFSLSVWAASIPSSVPSHPLNKNSNLKSNPRVLILGGGVAGIIAARTLHRSGLNNYLIMEARDEIGGRLRKRRFGGKENFTIEVGANWVQGTQQDHGPSNPIWELAKKHHVRTVYSNYSSLDTYDENGAVDYLDVVDAASENFERFIYLAGRLTSENSTHLNAREGYTLSGSTPRTPREKVAEYWNFDWEFADTPEQSSFRTTASTYNNTFVGFSDENRLSVDQRGFGTIITAEADEFVQPSQLLLNATVRRVEYSDARVRVILADGTTVDGDYALCTFSLGVLQNKDVLFNPNLPTWKNEAIHLMKMTTFTKIFLRFEKKFWFDSQFGLHAHQERGLYPVWQSLDVDGFLPGSGILFSTVTGNQSERIESLSNAQVQSEVMGVLRSMYPNITIPEPTDFFFPRWHSDPLYRGSFSNWPPSFTKEHQDNLRANVGERLWFAGEATSSKYYGFLHGAYTEGLGVAQEMIKCINQGQCNGFYQS